MSSSDEGKDIVLPVINPKANTDAMPTIRSAKPLKFGTATIMRGFFSKYINVRFNSIVSAKYKHLSFLLSAMDAYECIRSSKYRNQIDDEVR
jgi:hypothetical protein